MFLQNITIIIRWRNNVTDSPVQQNSPTVYTRMHHVKSRTSVDSTSYCLLWERIIFTNWILCISYYVIKSWTVHNCLQHSPITTPEQTVTPFLNFHTGEFLFRDLWLFRLLFHLVCIKVYTVCIAAVYSVRNIIQ